MRPTTGPLPATHALEQSYLKRVDAARPGHPPDLSALPVDHVLRPHWRGLNHPAQADFWPQLETLLRLSLSPLRIEPHATYNPHRAYPSPRALYAVHAVLDTPRGTWLIDANQATLRRVQGAAFTPPSTARLHLLGHLPTLPASYGALRPTLAALEAGHLLGALRHLGLGLGLTLTRQAPERPAGLDPAWWPLLTLTLTRAAGDAAAAAAAWDDVTRRSSGPGPFGLLTDGRPAPAAPFQAALTHPDVTLLALNLTDLPPGVYGQGGGASPTDLTRALQDAYSYPDDLNVASLNAALLLSASYHPDRPFLDTQIDLGERAQRACLTLARAGLFARPVRAYREGPLDALLNLRADQTVAYVLLCGRAPVHDLSLPLLRRTA